MIARRLDVRDAAGIEALADEAEGRFGAVDLWVNNAGVLEPIAPVRDVSVEAFREHVDTNLVGVFTILLDRPLKDGDAVWQRVAEGPCALGERRPLVEPVQRVGRLDVHFTQQLRARLGLDDEGQPFPREGQVIEDTASV